MVTQLPIEPYWFNAAMWWVKNVGLNESDRYNQWLIEQGVVGLPRAQFTPYLEFETEAAATMFRIKWA